MHNQTNNVNIIHVNFQIYFIEIGLANSSSLHNGGKSLTPKHKLPGGREGDKQSKL